MSSFSIVRIVAAGASLLGGLTFAYLPADAEEPSAARLRHPVALALSRRGDLLLAANERSGSLSMLDVESRRIVGEIQVGRSLSDVAGVSLGDEDYFLTTDFAAHQLHLLSRRGTKLKSIAALPVSPYPISVRPGRKGGRCFVASLWSRKLTIVDISEQSKGTIGLTVSAVIALPFAPRLQLVSANGETLFVADAFGGKLAVIDLSHGKLVTVKTIPAQNIRGLAQSADGRRILLCHQTLNPLAQTTFEDIHWGSLVSNVLRSLTVEALKRPQADVLEGSRHDLLGDVGNGAGDPAALAMRADGTVIVALAGVGEIAFGNPERSGFQRMRAGVRPTALAVGTGRDEVYAADTLGDSIAIFAEKAPSVGVRKIATVSLGPEPTPSAVDRGERLFFDARLSHDGWMSCHSCHADGQSSDRVSDTLGDGSFGAPKRIPALGGVAETGPWAWNGSVRVLAEQVRKSLLTTMHARSTTDEEVRDLTEYISSLKAAPPADSPADGAQRRAADRGRAIFTSRGCDRCHAPPTYTSPAVYDVGIEDELGARQFNPPSLRGVGQRSALFHDGRAASLADVFAVYQHPSNTEMSPSDLADLLAFLRSL